MTPPVLSVCASCRWSEWETVLGDSMAVKSGRCGIVLPPTDLPKWVTGASRVITLVAHSVASNYCATWAAKEGMR